MSTRGLDEVRHDPVEDTSALDRDTTSTRERWLLALGATLTTLFAMHLRYQYRFLSGDQLVLSVKGISWADPSAFKGDWFNQAAPQPHWFFDVWTFLGEKLGVLQAAYLFWYLLSIAVFGYATARLAESWLPKGRRVLALAIGPIIAIGPIWILGTATPLLGTAVPHVLGGSLAYLALVGIIVRSPRLAVVAAVAAGIIHVQFGAMLVPILVVSAILWSGLGRRLRTEMFGATVFLTGLAFGVTKVRGTTASKDDYLQICEGWRNFHCYAAAWDWTAVVAGFAGCLLAGLVLVNRRQDWRAVGPVLALPIAGTIIGVLADRNHFAVLGELAQTTNVYRLAALVVPFAAWALVGVAADRLPMWGRVLMSVPVVWGASRFLREYIISTGAVERLSGAWPVLIGLAGSALAIVTPQAAPVLVRRFRTLETVDGQRRYRLLGHGVTAVFLLAVVCASFALARPGWATRPDIDEPPEAIAGFAKAAGERLPPGTRMIVPASFEGWRLWSRQPVIADCKGLPYGGKPYHEWLRRIVDLYVSAGGTGCLDQWPLLELADIEQMAKKYDAPVAVFITGDPKLEAARRAGWHEIYNTARFGDDRLEDTAVFEVPHARA
jgi:hypothetical protein